MSAVAGDRDGGDGGGVAGGIARIFAGEQAYGEAGIEGVACGGRVHGFYGEGWNHFAEAIGSGEERALGAHFDYDIFGAACEEKIGAAGGCFGRDRFGGREAAKNARLAFVGSDPRYHLEQARRQFASGRGIEHQRNFVAVRECSDGFESDQGDFELDEDHAGFAE